MKVGTLIIAGISGLLLLPAFCTAELRVTLNNGRSIIAESCRDEGGRLICGISGGVVEISRQDIKSIESVKIRYQQEDSAAVEAQAAGNGEKKGADKAAASPKGTEPVGTVRMPAGLTEAQISRLDQISERKTVLRPERETLIKEQKQLVEDVNSRGMIRTQAQYNEIKQRIADLDAKLTGFNDEVRKLNEEEKAILDSVPANK